jgi:hypothetical protein
MFVRPRLESATRPGNVGRELGFWQVTGSKAPEGRSRLTRGAVVAPDRPLLVSRHLPHRCSLPQVRSFLWQPRHSRTRELHAVGATDVGSGAGYHRIREAVSGDGICFPSAGAADRQGALVRCHARQPTQLSWEVALPLGRPSSELLLRIHKGSQQPGNRRTFRFLSEHGLIVPFGEASEGACQQHPCRAIHP